MREDVNAKAACGHPLYWHQCYRGTYDLWHPDAFQHPAKMSIPLAYRIMQHLKDLGLLNEGEYLTITPEILYDLDKMEDWCNCETNRSKM